MENRFPEFGFNVQRILDCGFQIEEMINPSLDDTLISYGMGFYFNVEESWVQFNIRADFVKEPKEIFATGTVLTKFGIQNLKSFADENGTVNWPANALETMFGIAFSHMRAMVSKNLAGTRFSDYVIPLINPAFIFKQLIEKDPMYNAEMIKRQIDQKKATAKKTEKRRRLGNPDEIPKVSRAK